MLFSVSACAFTTQTEPIEQDTEVFCDTRLHKAYLKRYGDSEWGEDTLGIMSDAVKAITGKPPKTKTVTHRIYPDGKRVIVRTNKKGRTEKNG